MRRAAAGVGLRRSTAPVKKMPNFEDPSLRISLLFSAACVWSPCAPRGGGREEAGRARGEDAAPHQRKDVERVLERAAREDSYQVKPSQPPQKPHCHFLHALLCQQQLWSNHSPMVRGGAGGFSRKRTAAAADTATASLRILVSSDARYTVFTAAVSGCLVAVTFPSSCSHNPAHPRSATARRW
jgi:hypothetical protein